LPPEAKEKVQQGLAALEKSGMGLMKPTSDPINTVGTTQETVNTGQGKIPESLQQEAQQELRPGFKFRLAMTIVFFILALVYILWLLKMVPW
jgi:hypothetical protein